MVGVSILSQSEFGPNLSLFSRVKDLGYGRFNDFSRDYVKSIKYRLYCIVRSKISKKESPDTPKLDQ